MDEKDSASSKAVLILGVRHYDRVRSRARAPVATHNFRCPGTKSGHRPLLFLIFTFHEQILKVLVFFWVLNMNCDQQLRSTKENAVLILCWVSCVIQPEKIEIFSVMGRRQRQFSFPPPKIFAGVYDRPETGMDFGLAFMTPRSRHARKHTSAGEIKYMDSG